MSLGNFEWCVSNEVLGSLLKPLNAQSILVLGCGTSRVEQLLKWATTLYCVDNDANAIKEQSLRLQERYSSVIEFEVLDICIEDTSCLLRFGPQQCCLDKGTLDYMLCQDPHRSAQMLANVHNALELGGFYVLISTQPSKLLLQIAAVYGFQCRNEVSFPGSVGLLLCKEMETLRPDYMRAQQEVTDKYYKRDKPISCAWGSIADDSLDIEHAYNFAISEDLKTEYTYDMFVEDLVLSHPEALGRGAITTTELREFLSFHQ